MSISHRRNCPLDISSNARYARDLSNFMAALAGAGLDDGVCVVTDGELSGLNKGITVGQMMPEAACGGPLAVIGDGEEISIDLIQRRIDLCIPQAEIDRRVQAWRPPPRQLPHGWLRIYGENVLPLSKGAVLVGRQSKN